MQLKQHCIASAAVSGALYAATGSPALTAASFAAGVLIDVDHLIDYWLTKPFSFDIPDFFRTCEATQLASARLYLHSIELLFVLGAAAYLTRSPWIAGLVIGAGQHLALDQALNPVGPKSYFFLYRRSRGFAFRDVFFNTSEE